MFIAPFVSSADLLSACLVSRSWNNVFSNSLWGDPVLQRDSSSGGSRVPAFLRCVRYARVQTRCLTHTLDLSSARTSLSDHLASDVVPSEWLRDVLTFLPNLESLLVSHCSFLDYRSLRLLDRLGEASEPGKANPWRFGLRCLDISGCGNTVPAALVALFSHLPHLVYLDISSTTGGRHHDVLRYISQSLPELEILKIRNLSLTDSDFKLVVRGIGTRVWSLDVRDNQLTDQSVSLLVDFCSLPPRYTDSEGAVAATGNLPRTQSPCTSELEDGAWSVTRRLRDRSLISDPLPRMSKGLMHLQISKNQISADGVVDLLRLSNLRALDCGSLWVSPEQSKQIPYSSIQASMEDVGIRETARLIPFLRDGSICRLERLRISHYLISGSTIIKKRQLKLSENNAQRTMPAAPTPDEIAFQLEHHLRTLVLTDVPYVSDAVASALRSFLTGCARREEESHRHLPSQADKHTSNLKPQGLKVLQLEMKTEQTQPVSASVTEDVDSDTFIRASDQDFSFFAEELQDGSVHALQQESLRRTSSGQARSSTVAASHVMSNHNQQVADNDVISSIIAYRHDSQKAAQATAPDSIGGPQHWSGSIKVVGESR